MPRTAFLALVALALLAALPAAAAPAHAATSSCGQAALPFALDGLAPAPAAPATAATVLPDWLEGARLEQTTVFHGYCRCTCSRIPDCNTDADCSNHRCLGGISCC